MRMYAFVALGLLIVLRIAGGQEEGSYSTEGKSNGDEQYTSEEINPYIGNWSEESSDSGESEREDEEEEPPEAIRAFTETKNQFDELEGKYFKQLKMYEEGKAANNVKKQKEAAQSLEDITNRWVEVIEPLGKETVNFMKYQLESHPNYSADVLANTLRQTYVSSSKHRSRIDADLSLLEDSHISDKLKENIDLLFERLQTYLPALEKLAQERFPDNELFKDQNYYKKYLSKEESAEGAGKDKESAEGAGKEEEPMEGAGKEEEPMEGAGKEEEPMEGAGKEEEPIEGAGNEEEPIEGAGKEEEL